MARRLASYADLDATDRKIVEFLRRDGRTPFREIARSLEVSEGMVRRRVQTLLDSGLLRILAVGDPLRLGVPVLAATTLRIHPGQLSEVARRLATADNVRYVAEGVGNGNLMVESLHRTVADLHTFITEFIGRMPGVISAETFQVVHITKSVWDWTIPITEDDLSNRFFQEGGDQGSEPPTGPGPTKP